MPIDSSHPQYKMKEGQWQKCRDAYEGEDAVKLGGVKYLPKLSKQSSEQYEAYKMRSLFYGATSRTADGVVGAIMRKDPIIIVPDKMTLHLDDLTNNGVHIREFIKDVATELFITTRVGLLVDRPVAGEGVEDRPYVALYTAERIVNWREEKGVLQMVVLNELHWVEDPDDKFHWKKKEQYRELLMEEGKYKQIIHSKIEGQDKWSTVEVNPVSRGNALTEIPFVFVGLKGTTIAPDKPILLDLVNVNLSHYRTQADLEHGRHFTALPTPWFSGVKGEELGDAVHIGSGKAIVLPPPEARAGYMEFKGDGLKTLQVASEAKETMMARLGARLLEEKRKGVESAESARIHASGEESVAVQVARSTEFGIEKALMFMAIWENLSETDISVEVNKDLIDARMDPAMLDSILKTKQAGEMSDKSFTYNLARGELLHPELTIEEERTLIEMEGPEEVAPVVGVEEE